VRNNVFAISLLLAAAIQAPTGLVSVASAQQITLGTSSPTPVAQVSVTISGASGNQTECYWPVTIYPIGQALGQPTCESHLGFTSGGSAIINWNTIPGATGYNILRTPTAVFPVTGTCTNCLLGSNVAAGPVTDTGAALGSSTLSLAASASATIFINNRDFSTPRIIFPNYQIGVQGIVYPDGSVQTTASGGVGGINQLTGDATAGPGTGSQALTLATVNAGSGLCGDSTHVCQVTTNGKGLVTLQAAVAISGSGTPCTITALSLQYNNAGAFGCVPDVTFVAPHTETFGAGAIEDFSAMTATNLKLPAGFFQAGGSNLTAQVPINFQVSSGITGLTLAVSNPSAGNIQYALSATAAQASHLVLGTCNAATAIAECTLVAGDLPAAIVYNNQTNTGTASMTLDMSLSTATGALKPPSIAGGTTTVPSILYDPTNKNWHIGGNGVDNINIVMPSSISPANNDCAKFTIAAGVVTLNTNGGACAGGTPSFPVTVTGTVTSGGIPYFNSTTQESSSGILNTNVLVKGGGAGGAPANSSVTDNGTTVAATEPITTTGSVTTGSGSGVAGAYQCFQGTLGTPGPNAFGWTCPTTMTTSVWLQSPNAVPAANQFMLFPAPTSNVSQFTWTTFASTNMTDSANLTRLTTANTAAAAMTLDMHLATTANAFILPTLAGCTSSADGALCYDPTNKNTHIRINTADALAVGEAAAIASGFIPKSSSASISLLTASLADDGITTANAFTYTGTGGMRSPTFTSTGATAGFIDFPQGTTSAAVAPCNTATSICEQAPTAVTSYLVTKPGVSATGLITNNVSAAVITQGFSGDAGHSATVTTGSGTSIGSTSLCSTANCPVGTYQVNAYLDITTACTTTGSYIVNLIYTDDQGAKTVPINIQGTGTTPTTGSLNLSTTANFGQAAQIIRSTGAASINYSTTASACGTGGPMVGKLYLAVVPVM
jgi:hypothetical protein